MLVWINGAFGVGKTQVAHELHRRLAESHVADPEVLGFAMHKMLPSGLSGDFQDLPQWRSGVIETLHQAATEYDAPVLVPMTIVDHHHFDEVVGGLGARGVDVRHFALTARPGTLRRRLQTRLAFLSRFGDETWAISQIPRCVEALADQRFATHVPTDDVSVDEVVELVAAAAGLELTTPRLTPVRHQVRRFAVGVRHIRW